LSLLTGLKEVVAAMTTQGSASPPLLVPIVPATVVVVEARQDIAGDPLWPEEAAALGSAVQARRREFATARHCARQALAGLGWPAGPIPRQPSGAPAWPTGVVGSLTHCLGLRAAAVARQCDLCALGIDAEPAKALPPGVLVRISQPTERARVAALAQNRPGVAWDRLLFCAKEAVFKAWYPLVGQGLGFEAVDIVLSPDGQLDLRFEAPLPPVTDLVWAGAWSTTGDHLGAPVWVRANHLPDGNTWQQPGTISPCLRSFDTPDEATEDTS
jgi:4'-phosphopantetheinyl transferase EntD